MNTTQKNNKGFTILEITIVIALLGVLLTMGIVSYKSVQNGMALKNGTAEMVNVLRIAQNKSITSQDNIRHGVRFETDKYILYGGDWGATTYENEYALASGLSITTGQGTEVVFERKSGKVSVLKTVKLFDGISYKTVDIGTEGDITVSD